MSSLARPFLPLAILTALSWTALAGADAPARGFADPLLGRWNLTIDGPDGRYPSWLEIRLRTESELMAAFVGRFGSKRHAAAVSYAGGQLKLRVPVQYEQGGEALVFTGVLAGGRLSGQLRIGDGERFDWFGVRSPPLYRAGTVAWGRPLALIGDGLAGWSPRDGRHPGCWEVEGGVLRATPPCVDLLSAARYDDFRLRLEFRYPRGSNSGLYLRGRYEVQIQDDRGKAPDPLRIGAIYGFIAPRVNAAGRAGEWQSLAIELLGRRVTVSLNGVAVISHREIPGITGGALDSDEGSPGPLMLQGDHGPIEFRNIVITPAR